MYIRRLLSKKIYRPTCDIILLQEILSRSDFPTGQQRCFCIFKVSDKLTTMHTVLFTATAVTREGYFQKFCSFEYPIEISEHVICSSLVEVLSKVDFSKHTTILVQIVLSHACAIKVKNMRVKDGWEDRVESLLWILEVSTHAVQTKRSTTLHRRTEEESHKDSDAHLRDTWRHTTRRRRR